MGSGPLCPLWIRPFASITFYRFFLGGGDSARVSNSLGPYSLQRYNSPLVGKELIYVFISILLLRRAFFTSNGDSDEMPNDAAFHLGLHCL